MSEEWRQIPGYDEVYQVSNLGRVKGIKGLYSLNKPFKNGYYHVSLNKKKYSVHQLVAMAFLNHTPNGIKAVVDHIDRNKLNNNVSNLRVVSQNVNMGNQKSQGRSSLPGAVWDKTRNKWMGQISINGKRKYLGRFGTDVEAHNAYKVELQNITVD